MGRGQSIAAGQLLYGEESLPRRSPISRSLGAGSATDQAYNDLLLFSATRSLSLIPDPHDPSRRLFEIRGPQGGARLALGLDAETSFRLAEDIKEARPFAFASDEGPIIRGGVPDGPGSYMLFFSGAGGGNLHQAALEPEERRRLVKALLGHPPEEI